MFVVITDNGYTLHTYLTNTSLLSDDFHTCINWSTPICCSRPVSNSLHYTVEVRPSGSTQCAGCFNKFYPKFFNYFTKGQTHQQSYLTLTDLPVTVEAAKAEPQNVQVEQSGILTELKPKHIRAEFSHENFHKFSTCRPNTWYTSLML